MGILEERRSSGRGTKQKALSALTLLRWKRTLPLVPWWPQRFHKTNKAHQVMDSLLSTGEVAKLCGVTPDAVLKWIKKGRLPASRTPGGHYRISTESCAALGFGASRREGQPAAVSPGDSERPRPRCWEYFGQPSTPPDTCRDCLVYQARVEHCYKLAELGEKAGHKCKFCRTECIDCPFYRACNGLATIVLVITRDEALTRRLKKRTDARKVSLHFAHTGYESSTLIGTLRPAIVILDGELREISEGKLVESILKDDRVPGVNVFVARKRQGDSAAAGTFAVPTIFPFNADKVEHLVKSIVGSRGQLRDYTTVARVPPTGAAVDPPASANVNEWR